MERRLAEGFVPEGPQEAVRLRNLGHGKYLVRLTAGSEELAILPVGR